MRNLLHTFPFRLTLIILFIHQSYNRNHVLYTSSHFFVQKRATSNLSWDSAISLAVCVWNAHILGFEIRTVNAIIKNPAVVFTLAELHKCKWKEFFEDDVHERRKKWTNAIRFHLFVCNQSCFWVLRVYLYTYVWVCVCVFVRVFLSFAKWNIFCANLLFSSTAFGKKTLIPFCKTVWSCALATCMHACLHDINSKNMKIGCHHNILHCSNVQLILMLCALCVVM